MPELDKFQTIIYRQADVEVDPNRAVWVRIEPSNWGLTIATFREEPNKDTPEWQAMTVVHFDPCYDDTCKITTWDEHHDPENTDGNELILVASIDGWNPIDPSVDIAEFIDEDD